MDQPDEQLAGLDTQLLARNLRHLSDEEVAQIIGGDARDRVLDEIVRRLPAELDPASIADIDVLVRFAITGRSDGGEDAIDLEIRDGQGRASRTPLGEPRTTLRVGPVDFMRMVLGGVTGRGLYASGRMTVEGDMRFSTKIGSLFFIPG